MRKLVRVFLRNAVGIFVILLFGLGSLFFCLLHLSSKEAIHEGHIQIKSSLATSPPLTISNNNVTSECRYPSAYYKPLYSKPLQSFKTVRLVFFRKHKMNAVANIARSNGWISNGITKTLNKLISYVSENTFTVLFTSSKELSEIALKPYVNNSNVLAAGIPGAYIFTGTKREQYITYQKYINSFGCSIEDLKMMPSMYLLDVQYQCLNFFKRLNEGTKDNMWVLKNSHGFGGDQVEIVRNTTSLRTRFGNCQDNKQFIVQEYIQNLLLLNGRKFDIRALVLVANSQPYMLFYHEGYLRVVIKTFDPTGPREVHLTNTHVQSLQPGFVPDNHFWSFVKFQNYLDEKFPENDNFVKGKLIPYIKRISMLIIKSGIHFMKRSPSTFQLLGLDLMVTTDWRIWFIESNNYPLWPQGGWVTEFTRKMGADMFELLFEMRQVPRKFLKMSEGEWFRSWQLVWKEEPPDCNKDKFNPCSNQFHL